MTFESKKKNCISTGTSPLFCNLAEGGRVIYTINLVMTLSVSAVILIVSLVLLSTAKKKPNETEDQKQQREGQKVAAVIGIVGALLFSIPTAVMWWLVQKFDIIAVISIAFFIISAIGSVVAGSRFANVVTKAMSPCSDDDCKNNRPCVDSNKATGVCKKTGNECKCTPVQPKKEKYTPLEEMSPEQLKSTAKGILSKDACKKLTPTFCWDHKRNVCLPFAFEVLNDDCY